jgi:heme oxygenase (biliverdin-IX-beta and delta-forming)
VNETATRLSEYLRESTRDAHVAAEQSIGIGRETYSVGDYVSLLQRWHAFHLAWEPWAAGELSRLDVDYWSGRAKLNWIQADLLALRASGARAPADLVPLRRDALADVIGALYVTEGSTLGGQFIAKHLARKLDLTPDRGLRFFTGYGDETAARWRQTKALIDAASVSHDQTVAAARVVFAKLSHA